MTTAGIMAEADPIVVDTNECDNEEHDLFGGLHSSKPSFESQSFLRKRMKQEGRTEEGPVCILLQGV